MTSADRRQPVDDNYFCRFAAHLNWAFGTLATFTEVLMVTDEQIFSGG